MPTEPDETRPDPEKLLGLIKENELKEQSGKLKIFFGMCAGVGKTYSMLEAAHKAKREGRNVVIGIVETHGRQETASLIAGLTVIEPKEIAYRGAKFGEMDIDRILQLKPSLVLVDELAHSNIPGSRHIKRYQDVLEILSNGIDVYTTLNVQHLESRAETVKQITGTVIRETLPDSIFDRADDIELVDITPDELLKRLSEGKVYTPEKSRQAIENFFRKGNLTALREMALRLAAERVDWQLRDYLNEKKIAGTWKSGQRLLVAIGPSPHSADLIRWTRRLAYSMEAAWTAVYIETEQNISEANKDILIQNFNLARELGAQIITTNDTDIVKGILRVAKENNITQIVVGKSRKFNPAGWILKKDFVKRLIKESGDIDVYIVGGGLRDPKFNLSELIQFHSNPAKYIFSASIILFVTLVSFFSYEHIGYQTIALLFLLTLAVMPLLNLGPGPIILAALLSALSWDYMFIPPQYTFHISRLEDVLMFVMYFIVAVVSGVLSSRLRTQERFVRQREKRTSALYRLTKQLAEAGGLDDITRTAVKSIDDNFSADAAMIYADGNNALLPLPHSESTFKMPEGEWNFAQWVFANRQKAGKFTNTIPMAEATYYPLTGKGKSVGVIGIKTKNGEQLNFDQQNLLDTFLIQVSAAVEREMLNLTAKEAFIISESEKLYKTLFNSISHELKTPLTTIISASSSLNDSGIRKNEKTIEGLSDEIGIAARRLNNLVENLLDITRLETGVMKLKLDWHDIRDLLDNIPVKLREEIGGHKLAINLENEIKLFKFDFILLEQAVINIVRNCISYTPEGSRISISAGESGNNCILTIADEGPGFPADSLDKIFTKFYRVPGTKTGGTGLGLSIAKGYIDAHRGSIAVSNGKDKGAVFTISIPMAG